MADEVRNFWLDRDWDKYPPRNYIEKTSKYYKKYVVDPIVNLRSFFLSMRGEPYYWYHKQYRRVPTIDQCYDYDIICMHEADEQFIRDRKVDAEIVHLLKERAEDCMIWENLEREKCRPFFTVYEDAETNFFIKYGDMGASSKAKDALMKQKHRLAWERRHGPVGTGMKTRKLRADGTIYWE